MRSASARTSTGFRRRRLASKLLRRGHSPARVKKILGENFLAYFVRVEAVKAKLASEPPSTATLAQPRAR